ncbi:MULTISPECIES: cell wall anchor protein [Paraburkholderia]|uniref:Cell wall anchor protein n=1 Tax=Paraburkholderia madseniana TaxID=2599607 RepID=A0AAP5ENA7_9BURK|nr:MULTISPECIES: cell wall anchor protein [Paraburkholderia]MCX4146902.1 cell wall anchor protein [Paraburkholderia madseniana]MDN7149848.1 cell wall anchor protein [Paraburkholderia sp. WS6]MDQ6408728.1 cell wall anchor protein [Paraburkholderia madseniana]
MSGTVAIGNPLTGAPVTVLDATGKTASATSGTNGTYNVSISGLTAPFVITATDPSGASGTLYSVVATTSTSNSAPVTANVTPLTTAVAALLTASGNPLTLTQTSGLSAVTTSAVKAAVTTLDTALAPILAANGLSATSFDPLGGTFTPNQTGADAVIDSVAVTPSTSGTGVQIASLADPNTAIQLNQKTTVSTALRNPSQPANYLASLLTQLGQCMTAMQANANATSSACSSAIDANYLNDGKGTGVAGFAKRHTLFTKGTTLQGVKTVAFLPAGTLPAVSNPAALVYFLVTDPNGTPDFASEIVQQLPNGSWDIIGNQEQYNIYIASFLGRMQFTDSTDAGNGRYESGLDIQIPTSVTVNSTSTSVGSALVQGAGLPASGIYMLGGNAGFGPYLMFPLKSVAVPPVLQSTSSPSWPDVGMSTQYKWSWASLAGGSSSFTPTTPDYASATANVSGIQQYGAYTVTLFDYTGNQIGTPQTVLNIAPNLNAAAGTTIAWQTLGSDVIANLLTPGGSGTTTASSGQGASTKATIDWTVPSVSGIYPNSWVSLDSQGAGTYTSGVETYQAQPYDVMNWATPTVSGTTWSSTVSRYVDQLTAAPNAAVESAVQVQLGWQADGEYYSNTWQYNN